MSDCKVDIGDIVSQLEPVAAISGHHVGSLGEAAQLSIAVSLKRIADAATGSFGAGLENLAWEMGRAFVAGQRQA